MRSSFRVRMRLARVLLALSLAAAPSAHALPPEEAKESAGFEVAVSVAASWWSDSVSNQTHAIRPVLVDCGGTPPARCFSFNSLFLGAGAVSDTTQPHGWAVQGAMRGYAPPWVLGGRPWLELGYRQPIGASNPRTGDGWVRVDHERSALVTAGVEWRVLEAPFVLQLAPYAGVELGWFESELERGLLLPRTPPLAASIANGDSRRDLRTGLLLGLEVSTPILVRDRFRLEVLVAGDATYWLGGQRSLGESGSIDLLFFRPLDFPTAETEPDWSGSVRVGLRLRR